MSTCPSSAAGATVQPQLSRRPGGSAPEHAGERAVVVEAVDRSRAAPELAGSKRTAPEQGQSGRPMKKAQVRSKM
jgi:hypothetical protein